jgi:hypothetical protein
MHLRCTTSYSSSQIVSPLISTMVEFVYVWCYYMSWYDTIEVDYRGNISIFIRFSLWNLLVLENRRFITLASPPTMTYTIIFYKTLKLGKKKTTPCYTQLMQEPRALYNLYARGTKRSSKPNNNDAVTMTCTSA